MVATKIFKKCSPHGRLYLYLGQREFISADGLIDDIKGIAYVPELNEIQGKLIIGLNAKNMRSRLNGCGNQYFTKATLLRELTLTEAHLNFALASSHGEIQNRAQMRCSQSDFSE